MDDILATLTLPIPPSVNAMYKRGRKRVYKTDEAIAFEQEVEVICINTMGAIDPITSKVGLDIDFYPKNPRYDIDNLLKALCDSLEGILYKNDNQIVSIYIRKHSATKKNPRLEVVVFEC